MYTSVDPPPPLTLGGTEVLRYNSGAALDPLLSPRPYLHPVRTLSGTVLTDELVPDHPHHLGLSLAVSDLAGANFWGGRTFTGTESHMLTNHGRQISTDLRQSGAGLSESLVWLGPESAELALESRNIRAQLHPTPGCWALTLTSTLRPAPGRSAIEISSSAVKGRPGAGYGGLFWRFPRTARISHILAGPHEGVETVHGSRTPWLSLAVDVEGAPATVVLAQDEASPLPWFVRTTDYIGAGAALAWSEPCWVTAAEPLTQTLRAVIFDGMIDGAELAEALVAAHPMASATTAQGES